ELIILLPAPTPVGLGKSFQRKFAYTVSVPVMLEEIYPLLMSFCTLCSTVKSLIDPGKSLVCKVDQAVAQGCCRSRDPLTHPRLCFQQKPNFFLIVKWQEFVPEGQRIVGNFECISAVGFQFANRVIAEIVDQHSIYN